MLNERQICRKLQEVVVSRRNERVVGKSMFEKIK